MASRKDWMAHGIEKFKVFAGNFCFLVETNAAKWEVSDADKAETAALKSAFDAAQLAADEPATRTSITIAAAKAAHKALEAHLRYVKRVYIDPGFESGTLTLSEYLALGLTPHDSTSTPVANPTSRPLLFDVKDLGGFAVQMHFKDEHIEHSQAVLPGCNGCLVNYQYGPEQTSDVNELVRTQLFTASPAILRLSSDAEGAWLSIAPRWQLAKDGILGPWGVVEHVRVT
jgi:hypothetical protein